MDHKKIQEKIAEGYIQLRIIIEVIGKPKDFVEQSLKSHLDKIKSDKTYLIVKETVEPAEKQENFFSTFAEIELLVKKSADIISLCFDYMPSSVEILAPEKIIIKNSEFAGFLNDLQARLLALNTGIIQLKDKNTLYIKNAAVLLRNFIVVLLSTRQLTLDEMQPYIGVKKEDIEKVLNVLIKENKVKKQGKKYSVVPKK